MAKCSPSLEPSTGTRDHFLEVILLHGLIVIGWQPFQDITECDFYRNGLASRLYRRSDRWTHGRRWGSSNVENDAVPPNTVHGPSRHKNILGATENVSASVLAGEICTSS